MPKFDVHLESRGALIRGCLIVEAPTLEAAIERAIARSHQIHWVVVGEIEKPAPSKVYNYDTGVAVFRREE